MVTRQKPEPSVSATVDRLIAELAAQALTRDDHVARLEREIAAYEEKYKIPSAEVHQRIEDGLLDEDLDVCDWLITLDILEYERG